MHRAVRIAFEAVAAVVMLACLAACGGSATDCPPGSHLNSVYCHLADSGMDVVMHDGAVDVPADHVDAACGPPGSACGAGLTCAAAGTCTCGNHVVDPGEECDNGSNATGSGCEPTCQFTCSATRTCPATPMNQVCMGVNTCDPTSHRCTPPTPAPAGTSCGSMDVCDGSGHCIPCAEGSSCMGSSCHVGALMGCSTGSPHCVDTSTAPPGTMCTTTDMMPGVCDSSGACHVCHDGMDCSTDPCSPASIVCSTGAPVCTPGTRRPMGTPCTTGTITAGVCNMAGACVPCMTGMSCTPATPCHNGAIDCSSGAPVCNPTTPTTGATCMTGATGGMCDATGCCVTPCTPSVCHTGTSSSCAPGCTSTGLVPPGTVCGGSAPMTVRCDSTGACSCVDGVACTPSVCHVGVTNCSTGSAVCMATGNAPDGTLCTGGVCMGGTCRACVPGSACTPANPCHTGTMVCSTGTPTCMDTGTALPPGTSCGATSACGTTGMCDCTGIGSSCTPTNPCHTGTVSCSTGTRVCVDSGTPVPACTSCGATSACNATGTCSVTGIGSACTDTPACRSGTIRCAAGAASCSDTTTLPAGTLCSAPSTYCSTTGTCTCVAGAACSPANPCQTGTISCSTGAQVCNPTGNRPPGTVCPTGVCDGSGTCVCGGVGQPCCAGGSCASGGECISGTCRACGTAGSPCCGGTTCFGSSTCVTGTCQPCGGGSQPCCGGAVCDSGFFCETRMWGGAYLHCADCGAPGAWCMACGGFPMCSGGSCVSFEGGSYCSSGTTNSNGGPCSRAAGAMDPCTPGGAADPWVCHGADNPGGGSGYCMPCGAHVGQACCGIGGSGSEYCYFGLTCHDVGGGNNICY